jgi:phage tail sheath protein FI
MAVYLAPGVYGRDVDLSDIVRNQATSIGAVVGQSTKGPAGQRLLFTNPKQVVDLLGKPDVANGYAVHTLICALEEMSRCYFYRVIKRAKNAGLLINKALTNPVTYNPSDGVDQATPNIFSAVRYTNIGSGNGATVTFSGNIPDTPVLDVIRIRVGTDTIFNVNVDDNSGALTGEGINSGLVNFNTGALSFTLMTAPAQDASVAVLTKFSDTTNTCFMVYAENPGLWGNNIKVQTTPVPWNLTAFNIRVFEVIDGLDILRESFEVSRISQLDGRGGQMYLEEKVNGRSSYIRVQDNYSIPQSIMPAMMSAPERLSRGTDGDAISEGDIIEGWQAFRNPAEVDMNILINGGYVSSESHAVQSSMQALCEMRRDCFAVFDIPWDKTRMFPTTTAVDWRVQVQNINSNFTALYSPWVLVYDTYNDIRNLPIPPSGFVAQVMARTHLVREAWTPPAGYNRGILVSQTLPPMDVTDRYGVPGIPGLIGELESLYEAPSNINPIIFSPGDGIVVFGQKTQQTKPSALDRINVRFLVIVTERAAKQFLKYKLFELNNKYTRRDIVSALTQYYADVQSRNGVYTFRVVCDESNNTPQIIDDNQLNVDVYLQPQRAAEFIQLQSIITRTGVDFRVLILQGGNF